MREEEPNWFARWEEELPTPEELTPISQTLITPDLAHAFDIPSPAATSAGNIINPNHHHQQPELESSDMGGESGGPGEDQARTLKRPRLVWTPQLHKRFVDSVAHLGIKNAVPKNIMQLMSVDGLTRENVASHLQKYRLYLKRMQGKSSGGPISPVDAATDHLFASAPLPRHFLIRGPAATSAAVANQRQQFYHQRHVGSLGSPAGLYMDDLELSKVAEGGGRKVLTLFPTGED